jgi:CubicO group peptidase (beta-lactamase class C family)
VVSQGWAGRSPVQPLEPIPETDVSPGRASERPLHEPTGATEPTRSAASRPDALFLMASMMTTNRLDDFPELPESVRRTQPWGLGWRMNHPGTPGSWSDLLVRHVFGHTSATGTMVWMDPATRGFCLLLTSALREKAPWRLVHLSNAVAASFV